MSALVSGSWKLEAENRIDRGVRTAYGRQSAGDHMKKTRNFFLSGLAAEEKHPFTCRVEFAQRALEQAALEARIGRQHAFELAIRKATKLDIRGRLGEIKIA